MAVFEKIYPYLNEEVYHTLMTHPVNGIPRIHSVERVAEGYLVRQEFVAGVTLTEMLKQSGSAHYMVMQGSSDHDTMAQSGSASDSMTQSSCDHDPSLDPAHYGDSAHGLFEPAEAAQFVLELCKILKQLHGLGIVHGDLKPDNILIAQKDGRIHLIDFNASHMIVKKRGRDTVMLGTPGFASPEQYGFSRSDERSDIYAIGQLLNFMITGCYTQQKLTQEPIQNVIRKCAQIDPKWRYQNIDILVFELKQYETAGHEKRKMLPPGFRTRRGWKMIIGGLGYIFGTVFAASLSVENTYSAPVQFFAKTWYILMFYVFTAVVMNYMDINEIFPFARKSLPLRWCSKLMELLVLGGAALFVYALIVSAFFIN